MFKRVVILEGFDKVGKTTYAANNLEGYRVYRPEESFIDETVGIENRWLISTVVLDFVQSGIETSKFVLNRSIFSSYVYAKLTGIDISEKILDWFKTHKYLKYGTTIIHIKHRDKLTARIIYGAAEKDGPTGFKSFAEYWDYYLKAEKLYEEIYQKLDITPTYVYSYTKFDGTPLWGVVQ